jgi:hypothetical protein
MLGIVFDAKQANIGRQAISFRHDPSEAGCLDLTQKSINLLGVGLTGVAPDIDIRQLKMP